MKRTLLALLLALSATSGMWAHAPEKVPIERLLRNLAAYVNAHPKDAQGHYVLGRAHSWAFAYGDKPMWVVKPPADEDATKRLPKIFPDDDIRRQRDPAVPPGDGMYRHLRRAVFHYGEATRLDRKRAIAWLGHGWMAEQASRAPLQAGAPPGDPPTPAEKKRFEALAKALADPKQAGDAKRQLRVDVQRAALVLAGYADDPKRRTHVRDLLELAWQKRAIAAFRRAVKLRLAKDRQAEFFGPSANSAVGLEAAQGLVRILRSRPLTDAEEKEANGLEKDLANARNKGRAITPIVFSLDRAASLAELLAPEMRVRFDLDGDDVESEWPWVQPTTGILVWDPDGTGKIRSGRQLFGSVTWWFFWENGYQALDALDDDRNGWLEGGELQGIAVWRDENSNGVSDPGEVVPLGNVGVVGVAARPAGESEGVPWNPQGVRLRDGRLLPTYDWVVGSHPPR